VVIGAESRGFILGGGIAHALGAGFVAARKPGKLPGQTIGHDYALEYGTDRLEIQVGAIRPGQRVLIHDDLLATGGTSLAKVALVESQGGIVVGSAFVIELNFSVAAKSWHRMRCCRWCSTLTRTFRRDRGRY